MEPPQTLSKPATWGWWALAGAVSPRRALRVDTPAAGGGWAHEYRHVPWPAEEPASPYAVYLARGDRYPLLFADLDASRGDVGPDLNRLCALLADLGVSHVVVESGPTGGRHVWVRAAGEGLPADLVAGIGRALGRWLPTADAGMLANPATGCARPPGAPHRHGGRAEVLAVYVAGDAEDLVDPDPAGAAVVLVDGRGGLDELTARMLLDRLAALAPTPADPPRVAAGPARQVATDRAGRPYLPGRPVAWDALPNYVRQTIATLPRTVNASDHLARVLMHLAHRHWTYDMVADLERRPGAQAFEHVRTRPARGRSGRVPRRPAETAAMLARQWSRAVTVAARTRMAADDAARARVRTQVARIRAAARTVAQWRVQSGETDRAVLTALCEVALACGHLTVGAAIRRLSEVGGISKSAVDRALRRLALDHRITQDAAASGTLPATWRLEDPSGWVECQSPPRGRGASVPPSDSSPDPTGEVAAEMAVLGADVWAPRHRYGGLGRQAARVYVALGEAEQPLDVPALAGRVSHTRRTVAAHLARMAAVGLARRTKRGWRPGRRSLDAAAKALGCHGVGADRARRYAGDRAVYSWWVDELAQMRAPRAGVRTGPRVPVHQGRVPIGRPDRAGRRRYPRDPHGRADHQAAAELLDPAPAAAPASAPAATRRRPNTPRPASRPPVATTPPAVDEHDQAAELLTRVLGAVPVVS